jgi:hypothetical protein
LAVAAYNITMELHGEDLLNGTESELNRIQNLMLDAFCAKNGLVMTSSRKQPIKADYITSILCFVGKHSKDEECIMTTKL